MKSRTLVLLIANALIFSIGIGGLVYKKHHATNGNASIEKRQPINYTPIDNPIELPPIKNNITQSHPSYMNYDQTVAQLQQWNKEAPEITEIGVYGKSSRGKDCYYLRVFNKRYSKGVEKPRVLVTACIHGNEPLASSTTMWYIGTLLDKYGKDEAITQLLDSRDIYFVPVVSPDSYPMSRMVDGVDPNRDFPRTNDSTHKSVPPVQAIQDLFMKIKPNVVMSGHTWGRTYLTPYGDNMQKCPDHEAIMEVMNKVKGLSGYRCFRACEMYGVNGDLNNPPIRVMGEGEFVKTPIYGTEVDWYYRHGSFAIVCEYGTHQRVPTDEDTSVEFNKTFQGFLLFVREAPLVQLSSRR